VVVSICFGVYWRCPTYHTRKSSIAGYASEQTYNFTIPSPFSLSLSFSVQFCVKYKIPDDVAGATFMAAAASSPEMFAAFISLYFTHSALGVGTILGSELFNHLIISAGSIYYSNGGTIKCDWRLVGREAFFYFLSMLVLVRTFF